jgi:hypothetical protein
MRKKDKKTVEPYKTERRRRYTRGTADPSPAQDDVKTLELLVNKGSLSSSSARLTPTGLALPLLFLDDEEDALLPLSFATIL